MRTRGQQPVNKHRAVHKFLPAYNSLTDKHLADYFSNSRIRKHLLRAGLITRSGRIVPEKEYRHKLIQTANQNHVQECLAQAIVHKVLEREHYHQIDVKRKQVEFEKKQRVQRFKVERCKKYEEEMIRALTPCPPTTSRSIWEQLSGPLGKHFAPCDIPSLTRPSTAPGKMQRPVRLKPIHRRSSTALPRHISPYRKSLSFLESQPYNCLANFKSRRRFTTKDIYPGLDSFCLPVTKNFIIPTPPAVPPTGAPSSTIRGRRLRPSTSSSGVEYPSRLKGSIHQSRVQVTMVYFGKLVHLSDHPSVIRDEIKVLQQHCGGENLCVYQGKLREGDVFQFLSRRHRGYPFSLTFYQNGLLVERLSSCCEYKHSKGSRIGGRNGLFGFSSMEGATPCYKCIVAMGVDKLPIPPPKKVNGDLSRKLSAASLKDEPGKESDASEVEAASDQKYESCRTPEMVSTVRKQSATSLKDENEMEADTTEEVAVSKQEYESYRSPEMDTTAIEQTASVESNIINDYEEDFEADNESSMEETTPQEMKSQIQGEEAEACEVEEEEVYSEENRSHSVSVMSGRYKETSGETTIPSEDEEREDNTEEDNQAEDAAPVSKKVKWINEETTPGIDEPTSVNNPELLDSAMDSTGIEIADTGVLLGNDSPSQGKYVGDSESEIKTEDELERAKSVQEKLAEAILKESQSSSEPEPSDTSTEEEEVPVDKAPDKENKEHLKALVEETNCEENVANEVVEEQKVFTEAENEEVKVSDHGDNTQEERVGEDRKLTQDEARTQGDKSEEPGEAHLPVDGDVAQDDKIEDPFERNELADVEASHSDEEKVEKGSAKPDSQHDESGQRAKSREEDESSVLEPSEKVDEPEVPDIAEAEARSETMETKAESSEEQEALGREEAPETGTDKMQEDSEEAQVTAENSSRSPEECGDSTAEETVDVYVEAVKTQSINDETHTETKQQLARGKGGQDDSQEENCGVKEESVEVHETAERQSLTHLEEITEAENKAEEINDESKVDESNEQTKNPPEGTECEEIQDEEHKDKIRETEKDAKDEEDEGKVSWGEPEAKRDDKGQTSEEGSETKKVLREKDDEAVMSENGGKEKVEGNKTDEEYEDITNNSVAEEIEASETTEVPEKSQVVDLDTQKMKTSSEKIVGSEKVSESKAAEGTEMHQPNLAVSEAETGEREAEKQSETGEIDAENGESSFAAEREPQEDEGNAVTSEEKRQTDEPDEEIESTEVKGVVTKSGDDAEKQEDSLTDQVPETGVPESDAEEADGSMVKHDEAASTVSEPETFGAEIQEERNANEEVEEVENENKVYNLILGNNKSDIGEVSPLSEISSPGDVEETAEQKDEGMSRSITDKPLETGENGEDTEEVSKASEEGASVLLKPLDPNTDGEDVVGEENPEALAKDDNTDMVTNWIQMHQTSKFFETFVEPLEDLKDEISDAQAFNPNGEEKESAELLRPESPSKMGRISEDGDIEDSRNETQTEANEGGIQGSEEAGKKSPETNKETDQHDSRGSQEDDKENQEGNTPFTTEVETFSSSLQAESDFENQSSGNANSGPGLIVKQTATDPSFKPEQSNSLNGQGDTDDTFNNISRDGRQTTQITKLTTSHSADGSQEEPHDDNVQTKMLERRFSGETRDIKDIKHTLSKERLSTFSLFGHTSYPLLTTSGSDGGQ
ncbi:glutamate-rich protein 3 isoform X1 [Poecilia formosa]|uniref:glutamate-rich protein 3 isoform X1 n=1 Tax=Poecilia formosa TaxID=48698 RepID=UPI0007B8AB21|nr:PREDICTED: glutamate-rich protein 3 isoform X1 [Poecilia formosa]